MSVRGIGRSRMPVSGSTSVAAQRTMRLTTFSRALGPIAISCVEQIELVPGRPAFDIEIAAEAQRMDRRTDHILERRDRGEVDDRDHLPGDVGEAVARRRAAPSAAHAIRRRKRSAKNASIARAPLRRAQVAPRGFAFSASGSSACGSPRQTRCAARRAARFSSASGNAASTNSAGAAGSNPDGPFSMA